MGNCGPCGLGRPFKKNAKAARVVFPSGEVKYFRAVMKAAELMLECPNFFLANSRSLNCGRRFSALSADEELEFGNVYIMFPMKRVNSIVTAADVAVFLIEVKSATKRISSRKVWMQQENGGGVTQQQQQRQVEKNTEVVRGGDGSFPTLSMDGVYSGFRYRLSYGRSRKPLLETINEELTHFR